MSNYTAYHVHTEDSLHDSCTNYKLYVDKAVELEQTAICFTEHGNTYNWIEKKVYCESFRLKYNNEILVFKTESERNKFIETKIAKDEEYELIAPLKFIFGIECYLTEKLYQDEENKTKKRDNYHTILIAKNEEGFKEINKLIDKSTTESHVYYKPRITFDEFFNISDNVIKISACLASPLSKYRTDEKTFYKLCETYDYYEIQLHNCEQQIEYNKLLYKLSKKFNKPLILGTDTHSINKYYAECRKLFKEETDSDYENDELFDLTYKSYDELIEMAKIQNALPMDIYLSAIQETNVMADSVYTKELDLKFKYPKVCDDEEKTLKNLIYEKLTDKLKRGIIDYKDINKYKANIKEEFKVFKQIDMIGFMLFMSKLVCWCWDNDIPTGFCRGSVGGSTIAYIIDIIDVNPIKWNTVFSRFANKDRKEIGDIDIDIRPSQRILVYHHIIESFGNDYTAYILSMGTMVDKGAIDAICRGLSYRWIDSNYIPEDKIGDIQFKRQLHKNKTYLNSLLNPYNLNVASSIKERYSKDNDIISTTNAKIKDIESNNDINILKNTDKSTLDKKDEEQEKLYDLINDYQKTLLLNKNAKDDLDKLINIDYKEVFYFFKGFINTVTSQSMHPAGIVVSPITLTDNYGTFWSFSKEDNEYKRILCINMEEVHEVSLVKYDILGLKNIGIIQDCCKLAGIKYPKAHEINWNDKKVWEDIITCSAGIFQFEGNYAFSLLKKFVPKCIDDLSLVNASLRPSGASYRDNLLAKIPNKNPSELIDELLKSNNGYLVYQEDVIKFLKDICGLSGGDADNIRRAIARKKMDILQKALPDILEGYCKMSPKSREIAEQEAKIFIDIMIDASKYMFGYNHSTGYSMIGYLCGLLRYYYPEEFICSYLNNSDTADDIINGTELAKIKNIKIYDIEFGKSLSDYNIDKKNHAIYKGISSIKFCNSQIANSLMNVYNKYDNKTFIDVIKNIDNEKIIDSRQLEILVKLNFFKEYGKNKYLMSLIELYETLGKYKQINKNKLESLGLSTYLMKKYAKVETKSLYKDIDITGLINELSKNLPNESFDIITFFKIELEYLNYITYTNSSINDCYYIVIDFKQYADVRKPYLTLRNINNGKEIRCKIKSPKIYENQPFGKFSVLNVYNNGIIEQKKYNSDDLENILVGYEVIKNDK